MSEPNLSAAEMDEQIADLQRQIDEAKTAAEGTVEPNTEPLAEELPE